jgi:hypothetical protein
MEGYKKVWIGVIIWLIVSNVILPYTRQISRDYGQHQHDETGLRQQQLVAPTDDAAESIAE